MRSRVLIGAGAWLLGAAAATGGSMLAVNSLANGLLGSGTNQLTPAAVQHDLDGYEHSNPARSASPRPSPTPSVRPRSAHSPSPKRSRSSPPSVRPSPTATSPGTLLVSSAGSAMATCQAGLAYLLYWSPDQGYEANDVVRGPASQASIDFESTVTEIRMQVVCRAGKPVAQVSTDH